MRALYIPIVLAALAGCASRSSEDSHARHGDHEEHAHDEPEHQVPRGPHGGRLFEEDGVRVELKIDEGNGRPTFVAHVTDGTEKPLDIDPAAFTITLERFGGRHEEIAFARDGDGLRSTSLVEEPHSFRATVHLAHGGEPRVWSYEQVEFRTTLDPEGLARSGIEVGAVGARDIDVTVESPGEIHLDGERVLQVRPRFPGLMRSLTRRLGDRVKAGDLLAVVQSNESLSDYEVTAAQDGVVISRDAAVGESVHDDTILYTIADFSRVWVDFAIYPQDLESIRRGQQVTIVAASRPDLVGSGTVAYVGPLLEQDTRVSYGRVVLSNPDERWQPGLFVTARVLIDRARVEVAVPEAAIVRSPFGPAVFRAEGTTFELQPVVTGRTDGTNTEIVEGLEAGAQIATANAFILKAELGKSEAHHDH